MPNDANIVFPSTNIIFHGIVYIEINIFAKNFLNYEY